MLDKEKLAGILESLDNLMLSNPELYLKLAHDELKNNKNLKVLNVDIKYIVKSNFVYINISSPSTRDITSLGGLYKLEVKVGFTEDMLKPQIKIGDTYREAETLEELNKSELTISFDNFWDKEIRTQEGVQVLKVEAVLHKMVFDKIEKEEIFKHYMVSIIHDRVLLRLRGQINFPNSSEPLIEQILKEGKASKIIPKSGTVDQIGFSKNEVTICDLEFMKMRKQSIQHTLNLSCYKSYDELLSGPANLESENSTKQGGNLVQANVVEEVESITHKKAMDFPTTWKELEVLKGVQIKREYLPVQFKVLIDSGKLVFQFKINGPPNFIDNLNKSNAHVSTLSARVTYDSITLILISLEEFVEGYHHCSLCNPKFDHKHSILMCNRKFLKLSIGVENICDAVIHSLRKQVNVERTHRTV
ncbi:hypothetical protein HWI79_618 [Cryptosporidium felis]|nr:hypothetical protein HWI79_618 [Cryptosporidium felis]